MGTSRYKPIPMKAEKTGRVSFRHHLPTTPQMKKHTSGSLVSKPSTTPPQSEARQLSVPS